MIPFFFEILQNLVFIPYETELEVFLTFTNSFFFNFQGFAKFIIYSEDLSEFSEICKTRVDLHFANTFFGQIFTVATLDF